MVEVSGQLRAARERAGLKIEEISARTKIKVALLQAIERGEFEQLPGEFFTRAFLRTYARELRLSPDEIVREYDASRVPVEAAGGVSSFERPPLAPSAASVPRPVRLPFGASVGTVAAVAAVIVVAAFAVTRTNPAQTSEPGTIGTAGVAEPTPPPAPAPAAPPETLTLEIRPSSQIWVTAMADGKRVIYRLLQPGEHVTVEARNEVSFRVGDAGAFDYSINGTPAKPPGAPGEVREFQITRDNYRSFHR
ncbi:MAG TPA: RodZ domain-containing protein [Vicinamibacterales bacterium]|nr:RodZ domain-containing protein [Vicinamibacterales bacterium]